MAAFTYKAKKGLSEILGGVIEAQSKEEALNKLLAQGLFPISIENLESLKEAKEKANIRGNFQPKRPVKSIRKRITSREILVFTQKLATLTRAKVELLSALKILYEQTENLNFKEIILDLYNSTKEGKAFSESLEHSPKVFSLLYVNIIKSGEASGRLDSALEQISEFLSREEHLKTKVSVALAYPSLLLLVGLASIFVLINFVVPKLAPIFEGMGKDLPLITQFILKISSLSNKIWLWGLAIVITTIIFLYYKQGSSFLNSTTAKLKRVLPIVKRLSANQELAHFSRSLGLLLNGGVPALKALEIATLTIESSKLKEELKIVCVEVASGQTLSKSMESFTSLPNFFTKMIAVGEESGRLTEVLEDISRSYTQQIEADIELISSLLEPVLILVLGLILGTIVLSILLPTFQITQMVR